MFHDVPFRLALHVFNNFLEAVVVGNHLTIAISIPLLLVLLGLGSYLLRKRIRKAIVRTAKKLSR
jgi:hypothetical protein